MYNTRKVRHLNIYDTWVDKGAENHTTTHACIIELKGVYRYKESLGLKFEEKKRNIKKKLRSTYKKII